MEDKLNLPERRAKWQKDEFNGEKNKIKKLVKNKNKIHLNDEFNEERLEKTEHRKSWNNEENFYELKGNSFENIF